MKNLIALQGFIWGLGWFGGSVKLTITMESQLEGFYGKASEDWEKEVVIEIRSPDETICPNVRVVGKRFDGFDEVAALALAQIDYWKISKPKQP